MVMCLLKTGSAERGCKHYNQPLGGIQPLPLAPPHVITELPAPKAGPADSHLTFQFLQGIPSAVQPSFEGEPVPFGNL